ncbi:2-polyprenyl-6-methoxyphenol hydroxylase-like FAD-dependent oxidoreductase [Kibdelosporangium banguiense]|uniref:2-polyprenyl-6-methoxyphenol hydroxylase-like FAD-dependent oxidoreductase n=1 Tax=Kibdelosporangium banguiense TaxID=1365924 RepID=A0ABS4U191_9PSEU|nr:2-polyprenyl-6-methoxyphenol hydroxylase-like FAD-dependent oxidoreductase [Kibdelosporangium banguiense]
MTVVGRGPVGMTTALLLARWGVPSVIVDPQLSDEVSPGSKAVLIAGHVMSVCEPTGVGERIAREGVAWRTSRTFIRGREVATTVVPHEEGLWPRIVNLSQRRVEELLLERVRAEPLITLRPLARLVGLTDHSDRVTVRVNDGEGVEEFDTSWLVGCDGARSTLRKLLGVPFEGFGFEENFLIVDIRADLPFPDERHFHFDPEYNPGRTVLIHPQPGSTWHIDWQVGPEVDAEDEQRSGRLDQRIRSVVGDADYELLWLTTYKFKQLRAREFRRGRCLLVGDAAHLTSPYGARGMNSGIADAENAAWRLAMVIRGHADVALLDRYGPEREHAADENQRITGATARFMCPPTRTARLRRAAVLALARRFGFARRWVDSGRFYEPATYPTELLGTGQATEPGASVVGRPVPDARVRTTDPKVDRLDQLLRRGVVLLGFPGRDPAAVEQAMTAVLDRYPVSYPITALQVVSSTPCLAVDHRYQQVQDVFEDLRATWWPEPCVDGGGRVLVIRPDAHVAASTVPDSGRLIAALDAEFPPPV